MKFVAGIITVFALASSAAAYLLAPLDYARQKSSLVFIGKTLSVEDAGRREVQRRGGVWQFPHDRAHVVVLEVIAQPAEMAVGVGDTVNLYFGTSSQGYEPGADHSVVDVEDIERPGSPRAGETATYCVRQTSGELRFLCRLENSEAAALRTALQVEQSVRSGK